MKNRVVIGKIDVSSSGDGQDMRSKFLVFLNHSHVNIGNMARRLSCRGERNDHAGVIQTLADRGFTRIAEFDAAGNGGRCKRQAKTDKPARGHSDYSTLTVAGNNLSSPARP